MIGKNRAFEILEYALSISGAEMTEAVLENKRLSLTRFAESRISDNIDKEESSVIIRAVKDNKVGVIATGDISREGLDKALKNCMETIGHMVPDEKFPGFPEKDVVSLPENYISPGTESFGPGSRAKAVDHIAGVGRADSLETSGAFRIEQNHIAVLNSNGLKRFFAGNSAQLSLTLSGKENNSGWVQAYNHDASVIPVGDLAGKASRKAVASVSPISLPDGKYTVILEPAAVGQLLLLLSFMGFGGKTFSQRRSFMSGKIGEKIAGDNFTVYEDPLDTDFKMMPFDYEGVARRKVPLIANGLARGVVYNTYYARMMEAESTGHALQATNAYGPYPKALSVAAGQSSIDKLIKSTERGILITHFWYLNFLNPMRTMVTGTTADGTFLIENGEIKSPIKNMRTNQSLLEAFSNIELITKERIIYPQYSVLMKVPGMKINNFDLAVEEEDDSKC
jgi:predicted Zn-dependent protease